MLEDRLKIPTWVHWLAQDSNGVWWGYSVEPLRHDSGWYENEVGQYISLVESDPLEWKSSLRAVSNDFISSGKGV